MDFLTQILQAAIVAGATLIGVLFFVVLVIIYTNVQSLSRKKRWKDISPNNDTHEESDLLPEEQEASAEAIPPSPTPIWEKYPQIYRFEILYWRGISKPWWWNNYANELIDYTDEYFPKKKVNFFATYNSNSKSDDYANQSYHKRIMFLRTKKLSKHPLVVINYSEDYIMVDSYPALEAMKDRIDAEWLRHYGSKKTYRDSPTEYT